MYDISLQDTKSKKMEIKGFIIVPDTGYGGKKKVSLHCCKSIPDVNINQVNLYESLLALFGNPDTEQYFESYGGKNNPVELAVKYVVLDNQPDAQLSFNDVCTAAIDGMMSCEYESGCYSEYTCGMGGFDFLVNQHSLFEELAEQEGKYIWLQLTEN